MKYTALARHRRLPAREPSLQLIAFQLRHHWFCLPLMMARRVIPAATSDPARALGMTQLHQENVPIVDVADRVYQAVPLLPGAPIPSARVAAEGLGTPDQPQAQSILVVDSPRFGLLGLLVDGVPSLKRARQSAFSPVPASYVIMHRLQNINTLVTLNETEPPLFLLEVDALLSQ
ncbi:MAG TPA: hypothetical protein VLS96_16595 [Nodosilinea sp.]|nr:hypothetical protein [Nodosilinea sp.]